MRTKFARKLLGALVVALMTVGPVYATEPQQQETECNSTDTLQGWGIWCGVDTYLAQQEPTAAGPVPGGTDGLGGPAVNGDEFGGKLLPNDQYNWDGYALFFDIDSRTSVLGRLQFDVDEDNETLRGVKATLDNGQIIEMSTTDFYRQLFTIYNARLVLTTNLDDGSQSRYLLAGLSNRLISEESFNEEGIYIGGAVVADLYQNAPASLYNLRSLGLGFAGSPTPITDMDSLRSLRASAGYSLLGISHASGDINDVGGFIGNMEVNFGESSWHMHNLQYYGLNYGPVGYLPMGAMGEISGNQFYSTDIGADLPPWQSIDEGSTINGLFLGPDAKALTGQADVTINEHYYGNGLDIVGEPPPMEVREAVNIKATFVGQKDYQKVPEIER